MPAIDLSATQSARGQPPLNWTVIEDRLCGSSRDGAHHDAAAAVPLSVLDRIVAPNLFLHLALVYPAPGLDPDRVAAALGSALARYPLMCARAGVDPAGAPCLTHPGSGAGFAVGASAARASDLCPLMGPASQGEDLCDRGGMLPLPELNDALFGHLPATADARVVGNAAMPLTHLALVRLACGGSVLGLRVSHMIADWGTMRAFLRHLSGSYRAGASAAAASVDAPKEAAAPDARALLDALLDRQQLPPGFRPARLRVFSAEEAADIGAAAATCVAPTLRTTWRVPAAQVAAVKAAANASLLGQGGGDAAAVAPGAEGCGASSHDALAALVWRAVARLPGRRGVPHDLPVAMDMRPRLGLPPDAAGNAVWSAKTRHRPADEDEAGERGRLLGEVARELREAYSVCAAQFLPDLAWARAQLRAGRTVLWNSPADIASDMRRGQCCSVNETQWALDHAGDACFGEAAEEEEGRPALTPCLTVPGFLAPLFFPLVITQQAPPAAGGGDGDGGSGWMVHVWLNEAETAQLRAACPVLGVDCLS